MSDYEFHEPTFYGTTAERWEAPASPDLDAGNLETAAGHFLLSTSGFPPDDPADLELPVVDEEGRLNRNALANAAHGPDSVETLDVSADLETTVKNAIHELLRDEFESMPGTKAKVASELLAWEETEAEHEHEVAQKRTTDDEQRYHEARENVEEHGEERPEKGR